MRLLLLFSKSHPFNFRFSVPVNTPSLGTIQTRHDPFSLLRVHGNPTGISTCTLCLSATHGSYIQHDALPTGMNQSTTDGSFTVTVKIIPFAQWLSISHANTISPMSDLVKVYFTPEERLTRTLSVVEHDLLGWMTTSWLPTQLKVMVSPTKAVREGSDAAELVGNVQSMAMFAPVTSGSKLMSSNTIFITQNVSWAKYD